MNVGFVSLGCSKNLVDTEMLIGIFKENKYNIVNNPKEADIIVINTCGFIKSAKQEAIDTILEMAEYKKTGKCKYIIAMGCLVKRYKKELINALPEVDLFISIDEYNEIWDKISNLLKSENHLEKLDYLKREITTGKTTAYLKIAEGCSNRCTYCAIPNIRGPYVSRKMENILKEAEHLSKKGIQEIIVIAQDTTKYGLDIYNKQMLPELLENLSKISGIKWIRFLYAYPESITDDLIQVVKNNNKICKYFDIPIQHISNAVLKRMNRKSDKESIENVIEKIRKEIPNVVIRTTVMVGFPGETEKDFEELYNFVKNTKFDKLGAFMYSKEENTPAEKLKDDVHYKTKQARYDKIMSMQKQISLEKTKGLIGNEYIVLIDGKTQDNKFYVGRTYMDTLDMDGVVYIRNTSKEDLTNKFVNCKIIDSKEYDLIAEFV